MGLFDDFKKIDAKEWANIAASQLKNQNKVESLIWHSLEGISVKPYYDKTLLTNNISSHAVVAKKEPNWLLREIISITTPAIANKKALTALKGGANSLFFVGEIKNANELQNLLKDIQTEIIDLNFYTANPAKIAEWLLNIKTKSGSLSFDYLGELLITGNWLTDELTDLNNLYQLTQSTDHLKTICVNGTNYGNAGSTITQELAFSLAQGVAYFSFLNHKGLTPTKIAESIYFRLSISSNYFFEIAKIRAARILWKMILDEYKVDDSESMFIHTETSHWNLTARDPYVNMLRATTESMSAIIGGCDSLTVSPYDLSFEDPTPFAERIARNTQVLLKEEAFLDKVNNPADGTYYIEELTDKIGEKAWQLFQQIEKQGGFLACIKNNFIQNEIKTAANAKREKLKNEDIILVGTNKFINKKEKVNHSKRAKKGFQKSNPIISPIQLINAEELIEQ